jgi:hypothetical protein
MHASTLRAAVTVMRRERWWGLVLEPATLRDGRHGLLSTTPMPGEDCRVFVQHATSNQPPVSGEPALVILLDDIDLEPIARLIAVSEWRPR